MIIKEKIMTNEKKLQILKKVGEEFGLSYLQTVVGIHGSHCWFVPNEEQGFSTCIIEMNDGNINIPTGVFLYGSDNNKIGFYSRREYCLSSNSIDKLKERVKDALRKWKETKVKMKVKQLEGDFENEYR